MRFTRSAAALLLGAVFFSAHADVLTGKIVGVADGDTVTLLVRGREQVRVRVAGIDAPEKRQAFGQRSKEALSDCAFGRIAQVERGKTDRYGRVVGKVTVGRVDCGLRQIQSGLAWHYKAYEQEQSRTDRVIYAEAEVQARASRRAIWSQHAPEAPWTFRRESHARY
ncbi:thermonuclease family protein [Ramlibacter rhizophilus]|uniref:Thermonuclease family protein n=1 Tax=Ramlibacter rhizophilus TaxID=1781167 RepID=A0A4Z0BVW4_9BURK|nr:thermonuclease family protein [Ramlibacter rhizophilus]TFZ03373.1 thermonuclease family protein [Ramlibacter rhizophilus]